ncbi:MAG: protein translocase subunit SecD, partial [Burkholderiales bacterium]
MNRYPVWKYAVILVTVLLGLLYTLPNFFGESPAVQVSSGKATVKVEAAMLTRVEQVLAGAGISNTGLILDGASVKVRLADTDTQLKARDALLKALNPDPNDPIYVVALNLLSASPQWLTSLHALP